MRTAAAMPDKSILLTTSPQHREDVANGAGAATAGTTARASSGIDLRKDLSTPTQRAAAAATAAATASEIRLVAEAAARLAATEVMQAMQSMQSSKVRRIADSYTDAPSASRVHFEGAPYNSRSDSGSVNYFDQRAPSANSYWDAAGANRAPGLSTASTNRAIRLDDESHRFHGGYFNGQPGLFTNGFMDRHNQFPDSSSNIFEYAGVPKPPAHVPFDPNSMAMPILGLAAKIRSGTVITLQQAFTVYNKTRGSLPGIPDVADNHSFTMNIDGGGVTMNTTATRAGAATTILNITDFCTVYIGICASIGECCPELEVAAYRLLGYLLPISRGARGLQGMINVANMHIHAFITTLTREPTRPPLVYNPVLAMHESLHAVAPPVIVLTPTMLAAAAPKVVKKPDRVKQPPNTNTQCANAARSPPKRCAFTPCPFTHLLAPALP